MTDQNLNSSPWTKINADLDADPLREAFRRLLTKWLSIALIWCGLLIVAGTAVTIHKAASVIPAQIHLLAQSR